MGFELWVEPASHVFHIGGGSLPNESSGKLYLNFRNNLALLYKNLPQNKLVSTLIIRMFLDGVAIMQYATKGKFKYIGSILRAHKDFYKWMPQLREAKHKSQIPTHPVEIYSHSIIKEFFLKGRKKFSELNYK